jgi:hypothetical protein
MVGTLRETLRPDVILVEAQAPCGTPLRRDASGPRWPTPTHLAFVVAGLDAVGRVEGEAVVAGAGPPARVGEGAEPARVAWPAVREHCARILEGVPAGVLPLPFLASLARFADLDAMFALVADLWDEERVRGVLLGELVGDPRRDEADRIAFAAGGEEPPHLAGERIYCLYPSGLDDD